LAHLLKLEAAIDQPERITVHFGVELHAPGGDTAAMDESLAIIETKTQDGTGPVDRTLKDEGLDPLSLSKYRLDIGLVVAAEEDRSTRTGCRGALRWSRWARRAPRDEQRRFSRLPVAGSA
jgi:hypothetical protein